MTTEHFDKLIREYLNHSMIVASSNARNSCGQMEIVMAQFSGPIPYELANELHMGDLAAAGGGIWRRVKSPTAPWIDDNQSVDHCQHEFAPAKCPYKGCKGRERVEEIARLRAELDQCKRSLNGLKSVVKAEQDSLTVAIAELAIAIDTRNRAQVSASNSALAKQAAEEYLREARRALFSPSATEDYRYFQAEIQEWAGRTFGVGTSAAILDRLDQELAEFFEHPEAELADVAIMLFRYAAVTGKDLLSEARRKMEINRNRQWISNGDGTGQHADSAPRMGLHAELVKLQNEIETLKSSWRCFHCGKVFIDRQSATDHFGYNFEDTFRPVYCVAPEVILRDLCAAAGIVEGSVPFEFDFGVMSNKLIDWIASVKAERAQLEATRG